MSIVGVLIFGFAYLTATEHSATAAEERKEGITGDPQDLIVFLSQFGGYRFTDPALNTPGYYYYTDLAYTLKFVGLNLSLQSDTTYIREDKKTGATCENSPHMTEVFSFPKYVLNTTISPVAKISSGNLTYYQITLTTQTPNEVDYSASYVIENACQGAYLTFPPLHRNARSDVPMRFAMPDHALEATALIQKSYTGSGNITLIPPFAFTPQDLTDYLGLFGGQEVTVSNPTAASKYYGIQQDKLSGSVIHLGSRDFFSWVQSDSLLQLSVNTGTVCNSYPPINITRTIALDHIGQVAFNGTVTELTAMSVNNSVLSITSFDGASAACQTALLVTPVTYLDRSTQGNTEIAFDDPAQAKLFCKIASSALKAATSSC